MTSDEAKELLRVIDMVKELHAALLGKSEAGGFNRIQKLDMMWRMHFIWPWMTLSALGGAGLTAMIFRFMKL